MTKEEWKIQNHNKRLSGRMLTKGATKPFVVEFKNFDTYQHGRVITSFGDIVVVKARNPYGSHNLIVADYNEDSDVLVAFRHGNASSLAWALSWAPEKQFRKLMHYAKKIGMDLGVANDR